MLTAFLPSYLRLNIRHVLDAILVECMGMRLRAVDIEEMIGH